MSSANDAYQICANVDEELHELEQRLHSKEDGLKKFASLSETGDILLAEFKEKTLAEKLDFIIRKATDIMQAQLCSLFLVQDEKIYLKSSFYFNVRTKRAYKLNSVPLPVRLESVACISEYSDHRDSFYDAAKDALCKYWDGKNRKQNRPVFLPALDYHSDLAHSIFDDETKRHIGLLIAYNKLDEKREKLLEAGFSNDIDVSLIKLLTTTIKIALKNDQVYQQLLSSANSSRMFKTIVENIADPIVTAEKNGRIYFMNEAAIEILGDKRGARADECYYSDDSMSGHRRGRTIIRRMLKSPNGIIKDMPTELRAKDGSLLSVNLSASLFQDDDGRLIGSVGMIKDLREITSLIRIGNSLLATHNIDDILKQICEECLKLPKSIRAYIKMYDEARDVLVFRALSSRRTKDLLPKEPTAKCSGMSGFVFKTQHAHLSHDVTKDPSDKYREIFAGVRSRLVVPVKSVDRVTYQPKPLGVIVVESERVNSFSENDKFFLSTIATLAATAIENANLFESKTKIITELSALQSVRETISRTVNSEEILESLLDTVTDILGFDYVNISQVNRYRREIKTVKVKNWPPEFCKLAVHSLDSDDIQACVARNREEILLDGWDDRLDPDLYKRFHHENLVRVFIPIIAHGEAYGTVETGYFKMHKTEITSEEIDILRKVVNMAGIGIDQAFLLKEREMLNGQIRALNNAGVYIQSSRTENEAVMHIFQSLRQIGYEKGMLSLVNKVTGNIEGRYAMGENWKKIMPETQRSLKGDDILALCIREKRSLLSEECALDHRCDQRAVKKADIKSQYVIPLFINNEPLGSLQIDLTDLQGLVKETREFFKQRMEVLETFASQIAVAIRNARDMSQIDLLQTTLMETAHEFKSPIHNILTQVGGLRRDLSRGHLEQDEIRQSLSAIADEANRASRQMLNTLMYSDRSRTVLGINIKKQKIQYVLQKSIDSVQMHGLERGIAIIVKDNVKRLPPFEFDENKLEQVINNLLDNAIKYSHNNRYITCQGFDDGTRIHLTIWDKGQGIPASEFSTIFQGFTRSNYKDRKRYIPGTGLGLKICKELVEEHGGEITVQSDPFFNDPDRIKNYDGYDTKFTIILPKVVKRKER